MKSTGALIGCNDPVVLPQGSQKSDWEGELGEQRLRVHAWDPALIDG